MGGNLTKSPLAAVYYAALLFFVAALFPYSGRFQEALAAFSMSPLGSVWAFVYALWIAAAFAIIFGCAKSAGLGLLLPVLLTSLGLQWLVPKLQQLMLGEVSGAMTTLDTVFQLIAGVVCTALLLVLLLFVYKSPDAAAKAAGAAGVKFHIRKLALAIRVIVCPFIFLVLYYLLWYFLLWRVDAVREYYGRPEHLRFVEEMISLLLDRGSEVLVVLLQGLVYALFSLPLLLQMSAKRTMFLIANVMLYLSGALLYLIPSPVMPSAVRMAHLLENAVLLLVFGVVVGILLHTALRREEIAQAAPAARRPSGQAARPRPAGAPSAAKK